MENTIKVYVSDKRWKEPTFVEHYQDQLEVMENAAEARLDEMQHGCSGDSFVCGCGRVAKLSEAYPSGPSPYASPMCVKCAYPEESK